MRRGGVQGAVAGVACVAVAGGLAGCQVKPGGTDVVAGKTLFVQRCGGCHTLARAGTNGTTGPNLDAAFAQSRRDGMKDSTFEGVVHDQILHPNRKPQVDPVTNKPTAIMPAKIVEGEQARDVAAYVAASAAKPGKDTGQLGAIGVKKAAGAATEKNGTLTIPVAAAGLAFKFATAQAQSGKVTFEAPNPQPLGHNIAVEGPGVNVKGPVVDNGKVSKVAANLKAGTYTFYCSVPGHREAGMVGKVTVK